MKMLVRRSLSRHLVVAGPVEGAQEKPYKNRQIKGPLFWLNLDSA